MNGELIARGALQEADLRDMYRLFITHFEGVTEATFREDVAQKDWIIRIGDGNELRGFTSLRFLRADPALGLPDTLYSGDTIIAPEARASTVLARSWIESVRRLAHHHGIAQLHWLLLVSGFRTYRLLPVFWREFYPNHQQPTPAFLQQKIDSMAMRLFGPRYRVDSGVVRFDEPQVLRPQFAALPAGRLADAHIEFFARRNPGYQQGDELVCWTRLTQDNLTAAGARMWHAADRAATQPVPI